MTKLKTFFDKFKGYILTLALGVLTIVEMCGGFINGLCGEALTINGVEVLPLVTLGATMIVGLISNGYTKEQKEKIKALFTKKPSNEIVTAELKKQLKVKEAQLKEFNKIQVVKENELANFESELVTLKNTHEAKVEMFKMTPQLATQEDVQLAANDVVNKEAQINTKKDEIAKNKAAIENLTTMINAIKSQL